MGLSSDPCVRAHELMQSYIRHFWHTLEYGPEGSRRLIGCCPVGLGLGLGLAVGVGLGVGVGVGLGVGLGSKGRVD